MEYILFVLYFSFFLCLCALVCLYFSGCQEMTYRHEGMQLAGVGKASGRLSILRTCLQRSKRSLSPFPE